ncbi:MAG: HlyD family efflux transporter periplasmic adaptor subunit, partial [Dehalococcoidia bacterium]|nr:HlyD family efflux transporter periplasmic adaptor subunit [Dehalococcoidia bacterium]
LEKLQSPPSSEEVNLAKANSEKARVGLQRAQAHYDKVAFSPDISILIEASNLQQATIDYTIAQATYNLKVAGPSKQDTASAQNDIRVAEASLTRAQADLSSKKVEASLRDYDIQLASIEVDKTAQTVDQLNRQVSDGSIVAPYSGTVTGVVAKAGDPVTAFSPVIQLADPKSIELVADADDASLAKLTVGQKATITFNQWPGQPLPATVSDLPAASQQSSNPLLSFVAQLPGIQAPATNGSDRSPRLKLDSAVDLATGMQGKATFVFLQKDKVLLLPKAALRTSGSRTFANVQRADSVEQVEVRTGAQADDMVEILSGLQEGDVVIGPGLNRLPSPTPAQAQLSTPTPMPAPTRTLLPSPSPSQAPLSSPAPMATVAPTPTVVVLEVANTLGKGAFIRREPTSDPIRTWPDGAAMVVAGEKRQVGGMEWINVQDPAGNVGWMSSNVLVPLSGSQ